MSRESADPLPASPPAGLHATPQQQRRGMVHAILSQVASAPGTLIFENGLLLLYLTRLGFSDRILILLISCKTGLTMLLSTPMAHLADHYGIKRLGVTGSVMSVVGYAGMTLGGSFEPPWSRWIVALSVVLFTAGLALFNAGWFSLLKGFVPPGITGRFFGMLRLSWQLAAVIVVFTYSLFLRSESELWVFQVVLGTLLIGQGLKLVFYKFIPEIGEVSHGRESFLTALREVLPSPQFMPFCAYSFVLALFTVAAPTLFSLLEKRHLGLGDNAVSLLGGATMIGALIGFPLGGFIVDRVGTKAVFTCCHLGFMVTACLFPLRDAFGMETTLYLAILHGIWGVLYANSSIAMSTELFAVMPLRHRSLATAVWWSLSSGGGAMSGLLASGAIGLGLLSSEWTLLGQAVSQYDALLLIYGVMTGLMVVTLGLVPSVIGKPRWLPRS